MWFLAGTLYQVVAGYTVVLVGVALGDEAVLLSLLLGCLAWTQLAQLFEDISHNVTFERWEDTLESTFSAPVRRSVHLLGVALYALVRSTLMMLAVFAMLSLLVDIPWRDARLAEILVVFAFMNVSFVGLGMVVATVPLSAPENGPQATSIFQGLLLLVSGVYIPIAALPAWLGVLSKASPATYGFEACRTLTGIAYQNGKFVRVPSQGLEALIPQLVTLAVMGAILVPLGLWIFSCVEARVKRKAGLKRAG